MSRSRSTSHIPPYPLAKCTTSNTESHHHPLKLIDGTTETALQSGDIVSFQSGFLFAEREGRPLLFRNPNGNNYRAFPFREEAARAFGGQSIAAFIEALTGLNTSVTIFDDRVSVRLFAN